MNVSDRQIEQYLWDPELSSGKIIFLSGPRQVGKTTYGKQALNKDHPGSYYNWDNPQVRRQYLENPFFFLSETNADKHRPHLLVFDEIHKRSKWKDILKGIYDSLDKDVFQLLVTGSARLNWFRKSGDSLAGRYTHFHMLPLSLAEVEKRSIDELWLCRSRDWSHPWASLQNHLASASRANYRSAYEALFHFGGFPEPFVRGSERFLTKWKNDYLALLLREDLRDLTRIRTTDTIENIVALLPSRVGSPLSLQGLARDVESTHATIKNYLSQLEKLWLLFSISPYHKRLQRALTKEKKFYFVNWVHVEDDARRFENFVAFALYRACVTWTDMGFGEAQLWYIRNFDGAEVDFLLTLNGKPTLLVEAKWADLKTASSLRFFAEKLHVPWLQVVHTPGVFRKEKDGFVTSIERLLVAIP